MANGCVYYIVAVVTGHVAAQQLLVVKYRSSFSHDCQMRSDGIELSGSYSGQIPQYTHKSAYNYI